MNQRMKEARQILKEPDSVSQIDVGKFKVISQSDQNKFYAVSKTDSGLVCECPDHIHRHSDCKHIKAVLIFTCRNLGYKNEPFKIIDRKSLGLCKFCDSGNITKKGFRNTKTGRIQMFKCLDCQKRFTSNFGFERKHFNPQTITQAIQMYYQGMSVRDIATNFKMVGIKVNHMTIYNWISKYSKSVSEYLDGVIPRLPSRSMVRADEVWIKVSGEQKYLFASMDDDSRYWLASDMAHSKFKHDAISLLKETKKHIGRNPTHFITDGLPAYRKASKRVFGKKTNHISDVAFRNIHKNNNKMERLNGEIRDREKVFRGLKKFDTPIIDGMKTYYNYTKPHSGLLLFKFII